uniref:Photosystem I assembly protein Ycf4 n=1 Tax=Dictyopteris divaricata TaxID=156996 RepID=A0A2I4Q2G9_9PHAE|nr:photosystem I assembly protein ycf4 [Dictyopteris divaricata]YP_010205326.1 photosystem I assembly protein ycf4 [Grateloupia livida]AQZ25038.1 photosystem I assembly protein ycf4 [Dictyopteris divaricata]UAV85895.1 photosystem I assembly protein ycf4 [Grateloupia livida]
MINDNLETHIIKRDIIIGSRRFSNLFWAIILFLGGVGFLLTGISTYYQKNFLPFVNTADLSFLPQGLIMTFYGIIGLSLSLFISLTIFWDVGSGYNEFNKQTELIRIVRRGFPGKNRKILLVYPFNNIKSIKLNIQEGINPKRIIYLCTKDEREIPLTPVEQPRSLKLLENEASNLARFLNIKLEGL